MNKVLVRVISIVAFATFVSACGSAPHVVDSRRLVPENQKIDRITFVYNKSKMNVTRSYGKGTILAGETGFYGFGEQLVNQAPSIFQEYNVEVVDSKLIDEKQPVEPSKNKDWTTIESAQNVLLVYASSGRVTSNQHAVQVSYVFNANLLNIASKKLIWKARLDTSTWAGRDFVLKNFKGTVYDEKYANLLLKTIAEKMKEDGVI